MFIILNHSIINGFLISKRDTNLYLSPNYLKEVAKNIAINNLSYSQKLNYLYKLAGYHNQHFVSKLFKNKNDSEIIKLSFEYMNFERKELFKKNILINLKLENLSYSDFKNIDNYNINLCYFGHFYFQKEHYFLNLNLKLDNDKKHQYFQYKLNRKCSKEISFSKEGKYFISVNKLDSLIDYLTTNVNYNNIHQLVIEDPSKISEKILENLYNKAGGIGLSIVIINEKLPESHKKIIYDNSYTIITN